MFNKKSLYYLYVILKNTQKMKQTLLNVVYKLNETVYENYFILFDGDLLENLLPTNSQIISVQIKN